MNKRPDFADDLNDVQRDVGQNVSTILSVVAERNARRESPSTSTSQSGANVPEENHAKPSREARPTSPRKTPRPRDESHDTMPVHITTSMRRETKELLAEAAWRQKVARATPDSQQAIIEEALQQWFKRNGFKLRGGCVEEPPAAEPTTSE